MNQTIDYMNDVRAHVSVERNINSTDHNYMNVGHIREEF